MTEEDKKRLQELVDRIIVASKGDKYNDNPRTTRARAFLEATVDAMIDDKNTLARGIMNILWREPEKIFGDNHVPNTRSVVMGLIKDCFGEEPE